MRAHHASRPLTRVIGRTKPLSAYSSGCALKGIKNRTPIHTLRKLFGSLICEEFGIFAASSALRHSSIAVTEGHYIVKPGKTSVKLESLLSEGDKVIPMPKKRGSIKASARAASASS